MKILATFFILLPFLSFSAFAQNAEVINQVIRFAKDKKISQQRAWLKLLHIERNWAGIKGTQIADDQFFFSKTKADSEEELAKTITAFTFPAAQFTKEITNSKNEKILDNSEHPICKYPARLRFLQKELPEFSEFWNSLPAVNCTFQKIFLRAVDAKTVSFVFSSYYSDSPGSAFGHTFFRINRKSNVDKQELLDFGIGYAAQVSVSNPFLYPVMGLFGGFNGVWTNLPYYYKVREYNDFEARDLWSYDLKLSEEEVLMLTLHLWEVGSHAYTYYFFTQNCAYHMLTLLEAAAPRLHLIEHVPFYYVIPADSMKTLFFEKDLVENVSFRPSLRKFFQARFKKLDPISLEDLHEFAKNYALPKNKGQRSDVEYANFLDAALDLISLRHPGLSREKNEKMFFIKEDILKSRAAINHITEPIDILAKDSDRPDYSHGSSRFSLNYTKKNDLFGIRYRFAIHDLLDNTVGMPENSQLEFFNFGLKKYDRKVELEYFNLFKVFNLNPINFYEKKLSWGMKVGSQRLDIEPYKVKRFYSSGFETLVGYSFELTNEERPWTFWSMLEMTLGYADKAKNDSYGYGALGYQLGLLKRFNTQHALLLTFEKLHPYKLESYEKLEFEFRSSINKNVSLGVGVTDKSFKTEAFFYF